MAEQSKEKQANEQAKHKIFCSLEKEETLYSEDEKKDKMIAKMKLNKFKVIFY